MAGPVPAAAAVGMDHFHTANVEVEPNPIQAESKFSQIGQARAKTNQKNASVFLAFPWRHYTCHIASDALSSEDDAKGRVWAIASGYTVLERGSKAMAFGQAFIDESATDSLDRRLFLAGYIMTTDRWATFSQVWDMGLKFGRSIEYLRMVEANSLRGQFWGWSAEDRDAKLNNLSAIIALFQPISFEMSVSRADYATLVTPVSPRGLGRPEFACTMAIVSIVAEFAAKMPEPLTVDFIFDEQDGVSDDVTMFFSSLKDALPTHVRESINGTPIFRDDKKMRPLQAADMLAWHIRKDYEQGGERWSHPMLDRLMSDMHIADSLDRELLEKWGRDEAWLLGIDKLQGKADWKRVKSTIAAMKSPIGALPYEIRLRTKVLCLEPQAETSIWAMMHRVVSRVYGLLSFVAGLRRFRLSERNALSKSSMSSDAPTFLATSTKRLWRSASVSLGGRDCIGFFIRFLNYDGWDS
jgi:hypothetical protein